MDGLDDLADLPRTTPVPIDNLNDLADLPAETTTQISATTSELPLVDLDELNDLAAIDLNTTAEPTTAAVTPAVTTAPPTNSTAAPTTASATTRASTTTKAATTTTTKTASATTEAATTTKATTTTTTKAAATTTTKSATTTAKATTKAPTTTAAVTTTTTKETILSAQITVPFELCTAFDFANQAADGTEAQQLITALDAMKARAWPNGSTLDEIIITRFTKNTSGKACANIELGFTGKAALSSQTARKRRSISIDNSFFDSLVAEIKNEIIAAVQDVSNHPDSASLLPSNLTLSSEDIGNHTITHSYSVITTTAAPMDLSGLEQLADINLDTTGSPVILTTTLTTTSTFIPVEIDGLDDLADLPVASGTTIQVTTTAVTTASSEGMFITAVKA